MELPVQNQVQEFKKQTNEQFYRKKNSLDNIAVNSSNFVIGREGNVKNIKQDYVFKGKLGEGSFGEVHKVLHKKSKNIRALKKTRKEQINNKKNRFEYVDEIKVLRNLDHPNIMQIYEFYEDSEFYYLITEFVEHGNLYNEIKESGEFNESDAAMVMKQVLSCLVYAHSKGVVHRDLKTENIMIDLIQDKHLLIKIIDWGMCGIITKDNQSLDLMCGTPKYMAPEILNQQNYDEKVDIFACGVILYQLLSSHTPFYSEKLEKIIEKILLDQESSIITAKKFQKLKLVEKNEYVKEIKVKQIQEQIKKGKYEFNQEYFSDVSDLAKDLISQMLNQDPKKRPSASDCLKHPWFKENLSHGELNPNKITLQGTLDHLSRFHPQNKFQQIISLFISSQLTNKHEGHQLMEIFGKLDTNNDGVLSKQELIEGYKEMKPELSEQELIQLVDEIILKANCSHTGVLSYNEFVMANIDLENNSYYTNLKQAFKIFDKDKDGKISLLEIKNVLDQHIDIVSTNNIEDQNNKIDKYDIWQDLVNEIDHDENNQISFKQFMGMMKKIVSKQFKTVKKESKKKSTKK